MTASKNIEAVHGIIPPKKGEEIILPQPYGSADSLLLSRWIRQMNLKKSGEGIKNLIICSNQELVDRIHIELNYFLTEKQVMLFPDWETLPYEPFSPHADLVSDRLLCLYQSSNVSNSTVIINAETALLRIVPPKFLASKTFFFSEKKILSINGLRNQMTLGGYEKVNSVISPGEYSIRGNIIDIFPMGHPLPVRLELFDDEIESIRVFDPDTQKSIHPVKNIRILPSREFENSKKNADFFRLNWRNAFEGDPTKCSLYKDAGSGLFGSGVEYYLPLLHENLASIFSYLSKSASIATVGNVVDSIERQFSSISSRFETLKYDRERPLLEPEKIALTPKEWFANLNNHTRYVFNMESSKSPTRRLGDISIEKKSSDKFLRLKKCIQDNEGKFLIVVIAENRGRLETLSANLEIHKIEFDIIESWKDMNTLLEQESLRKNYKSLYLMSGPIHKGFIAPWLKLMLVTENDLFDEFYQIRKKTSRRQETNVENLIKDMSELKLGSLVVHVDHGIGRYKGLTYLDLGEGENEFLQLEYANKAKLYVPVTLLHLVNRYSGSDPDTTPLSKLGSDAWDKTKKKAQKQIKDTAAELLNIYARRALKTGFSFKFNAKEYEEFCNDFPFTETPDQNSAIQAVIQDMIKNQPMDRLVCGDVGFGKTEVALRATFIALSSNKQVAVLTPTTLLAEQHYQTFQDRFSKYGIVIRELSRFKLGKDIKETISGIEEGKVDIVIGTHRLISNDHNFKNLGLIIIDEEHRFGVRQKEKFKDLKSEIDTLTLTATPIPRTLALSMEGIREFSVIATAPQKRLAIKTVVRHENKITVQEALTRELRRGGQAYVLHNDVKSIENKKELLKKLIPEARIAIAHGQMPEKQLEQVMRKFNQKQFNVLLCTTIIETGIDIPSANTIVIYRADKFGLAQLHQLRGRVGRSHHQAYAYLLTPEENSLTTNAVKRLEAIQSMEELGSGFFLALHDLEIRGAGQVLGDQQSGNISEIGFSLYSEMLESAILSIKNNEKSNGSYDISLRTPIEVNVFLPALLPETYCPDVNERLIIYKRLANTKKNQEIDIIEDELIDRFGSIPRETKSLLITHKFRQKANHTGIKKLDITKEGFIILFDNNPQIKIDKLLELINSRKEYRLLSQNKIRIQLPEDSLENQLQVFDKFLQAVS